MFPSGKTRALFFHGSNNRYLKPNVPQLNDHQNYLQPISSCEPILQYKSYLKRNVDV